VHVQALAVAPTRYAGLARLAAPLLEMLEALAGRCEAVFDGAYDIEWAFASGRVYLLQPRSITHEAA
jgi:hypothetical protein